jgi:hypothetical protein
MQDDFHFIGIGSDGKVEVTALLKSRNGADRLIETLRKALQLVPGEPNEQSDRPADEKA